MNELEKKKEAVKLKKSRIEHQESVLYPPPQGKGFTAGFDKPFPYEIISAGVSSVLFQDILFF